MNNRVLIQDSLTLAGQQMERITILSLLLINGRSEDSLPECQETELDCWFFDLSEKAREHIKAAQDAARNLGEANDE